MAAARSCSPAGEPDDLPRDEYRERGSHCEERGQPERCAGSACNAAGLALQRGRPAPALALLEETAAIDRALQRRHLHAVSCRLHHAQALAALDRPAEAQARFDEIAAAFHAMAEAVRPPDQVVHVIPVSSLHGENVTRRSARLPWYTGKTLLDVLETADTPSLSESERRELDAARAVLAARFDAAATRALADLQSKSDAALAAGDVQGAHDAFSAWPDALHDAPQAAEAAKRADAVLAKARAGAAELVELAIRTLKAPPGDDQFADPDAADLTLRPGSKAVDAGVALPGINDGFTGKAHDLGCYEAGKPVPAYGPRPVKPAAR